MRISKALLATAAFAVLALFTPRAASAFDCDRMVVDEAGAFEGNDLARIERSAEKLSNVGADVRVRTVRDFGGAATLGDYIASHESACASWRAPDGGRKNNLIAIVVSYGSLRDLGMVYGDQWLPKLDQSWAPLLAQEMRPALRDGRNGDAFVASLDGVAALLRPTPPASNNAGPVVVKNEAPTDLSGLWYVLGAIVVIGGLVLVFLALRSRKREREAKQAAQQKAQAVKANCSTKIVSYRDADVALLESEVETAAGAVSETDAKPLRDRFAAFKQAVDEATRQFAELQGSKNDPKFDDYAERTYLDIARAYGEVLAKLNAAEAIKSGLSDMMRTLERMAAEVPGKIAAAKAAIETSKAAVKAIADGDYRVTDAEALLKSAAAKVVDAETAKTEKRLADATAHAAEATAIAGKATAAAQALPVRRQRIQEDHEKLRARIDAADEKIDAAVLVFKEISDGYAASCWETVRGNGSEAEDRVLRADEQVRKVLHVEKEGESPKGLGDMKTQDWSAAETALAEAKRELDLASSLIQSIYALKENLAIAKRDARTEIDAARKDVATAREFIAKHDDDIRESLETDLDTATKRIDEAEAELSKDQPDYLFVLKTAKLANSRADDILVTARGEHEAAERERAKAASALRDATAAVSAAKEYLQDHAHELALDLETRLSAAKRRLKAAEAATTPADRIRESEAAMSEANATLKTAQAVVDRKRREREEAERRERERLAAIRREREAEERRLQEAREAAAREERRRQERARMPSFPSAPSIPSIPRILSPAPRSGGGGGGTLGSIGRSRGGGGTLGGW